MLVEYFQLFVLFINYICYVDEFVCWGCSQIFDFDSFYIVFFCVGGNWIIVEIEVLEEVIFDFVWKKYQMFVWYLIIVDGQGIILVNIGVGLLNVKIICDYLVVLCLDVWLMIGYCGGLCESQVIGDYVFVYVYLCDDYVFDVVLLFDIFILSIVEV